MGVQVAFLARVHVHGEDARGVETIEIVLAGDVAGQHRRLDAHAPHLHSHLLDEKRLARAYGAHHVHGANIVRAKSVVDIMAELAVLGQDVRLHADVRYLVHAPARVNELIIVVARR